MNTKESYIISLVASAIVTLLTYFALKGLRIPFWMWVFGYFMVVGVVYKGLMETEMAKRIVK